MAATPPSRAAAGVRRRLPVRWLLPALAAVGASAAALYVTVDGVGASGDSAGYLAAARSLARGEGWRDFYGGVYLLPPPAYPTALGLLDLAGIEVRQAARWLAALLYGATALLVGRWLFTRLRSRPLAALALIAVACSPPLLLEAAMARTDLPFIFLTVAALHLAERYWLRGGTGPLTGFAAIAALALLTRYSGAPLVALGGLLALARPGGWHRRIREAAAFGAVAVLPSLVWLLRNWVEAGALFGGRRPPRDTFWETAGLAARVVGRWFLPASGNAAWDAAAATALGAVALFALVALGRRGAGEAPRGPAGWGAVVPMVGFAVLYGAFTVVTSSRYGALNTRFLDPLIVPLILSTAFALDRALARGSVRLPWPRAHAVALCLALAVWVAADPARFFTTLGRSLHRDGAPEFAHATWRRFDIVAKVARHTPPGALVSNHPALAYWLMDRPLTRLPPAHLLRDPATAGDFARGVRERLMDRGRTVYVWFGFAPAARPPAPADLSRAVALLPVWRAPDGSGAVYVLQPR